MPDGFGWSQTGGEYLFFIDAHGTIFSDIWNVEAERSEKPADIGILASACGSEDDSFFMIFLSAQSADSCEAECRPDHLQLI